MRPEPPLGLERGQALVAQGDRKPEARADRGRPGPGTARPCWPSSPLASSGRPTTSSMTPCSRQTRSDGVGVGVDGGGRDRWSPAAGHRRSRHRRRRARSAARRGRCRGGGSSGGWYRLARGSAVGGTATCGRPRRRAWGRRRRRGCRGRGVDGLGDGHRHALLERRDRSSPSRATGRSRRRRRRERLLRLGRSASPAPTARAAAASRGRTCFAVAVTGKSMTPSADGPVADVDGRRVRHELVAVLDRRLEPVLRHGLRPARRPPRAPSRPP